MSVKRTRSLAAVLSIAMVLSLLCVPAMGSEHEELRPAGEVDAPGAVAVTVEEAGPETPAVGSDADEQAALQVSEADYAYNFTTATAASPFYTISGTAGKLPFTLTGDYAQYTKGVEIVTKNISFVAPMDGTVELVLAHASGAKGFKFITTVNGKESTEKPTMTANPCTWSHEVKGGNTYTIGKNNTGIYLLAITYKTAHVHQWGEWVVDQAPTCTVEGSRHHVCAGADCPIGTESETMGVIAHTSVAVAAVAATCVEAGATAGTKCSVCQSVLTGCETIPATGVHSISNGACSVCGMVSHAEHTWNAGEVTTQPTCTKAGVKTYSCTVAHCIETKTEAVSALGHDEVAHAAQAASCTQAGWSAYVTCSRCDYTTYDEIPAAGHQLGSDGVCTVCGNSSAITAGGWFETIYAEIAGIRDADVTAVSYTGPMSGALQGEDLEYLVRDVNGKVRIDIPGLTAGTYELTVTAGGKPIKATDIKVLEHDRSGYAHYNYTRGVGAYRDDGVLKENAIVLYVTEENKNDVVVESMDGTTVTGIGNILNSVGQETSPGSGVNSKGGLANSNADVLRKLADDGIPLVVRIIGNVTAPDGLTAYNTADYGGTKGDNGFMARMSGAKDVTIEGIGPDATVNGWGFHFICQTADYKADGTGRGQSFEVRNISFRNVPEDCIGMEGQQQDKPPVLKAPVERGWVHNCAFYAPHIANPAESDKDGGDGACDFKRGRYFTMDYCYYEGYHKTNLVGSSDSSMQYHITWHHNYWKDCESRGPLGRQANMHIYNCIYDGQSSYAMNPRANCYIFSEYNNLINCKNPVQVKSGAVKSYNDVFSGYSGALDASIVTDKSAQVDTANAFANFDTNADICYIPSGDYKLDKSIGAARQNIEAYTGPMKAAADVIAPEDVPTSVVETSRVPAKAVVLPYNQELNKGYVTSTAMELDNVRFDLAGLDSGFVKVGRTTLGQDIIFKVDETVDISVVDGGGSAPICLLDAEGVTLVTGTGTAQKLPAGTYFLQSGTIDPSKGTYKEAKVSGLSITRAADQTPPHVHNYTGWTQTVEPSCTRAGVEVGTCSCGDTLSREIAKTAHSYTGGACVYCGVLDGTFTDSPAGGAAGGETVEATGLTLDQTAVTLAEGTTARIAATIVPSNATNRTVVWTSSDTAVATVAKNGTITAKGAGSATVTATVGSLSRQVSVSVIGITANTFTFAASSQPAQSKDENPVSDGTKLGNDDYFTVSGTGVVWRTKNKTTDKTTSSLQLPSQEGGALTFTVPAGSTARKVTISYSSTGADNYSAVGILNADGELQLTTASTRMGAGKGTSAMSVSFDELPAGTYRIVAPADVQPSDVDGVDEFDETNDKDPLDPNKRGVRIFSVTVNQVTATGGALIPVESVTLDQEAVTLEVGQSMTLHASVLPADASNKTMTWTSDNTTAVIVTDGTLTARKVGTANITATSGGKFDTCAVRVIAADVTAVKVTSIRITDPDGADATEIAVDDDAAQEIRLTALVLPEDADNRAVTWTSDSVVKGVSVSSTGVVTVSPTAVDCVATITATARDGSGVKSTYTVTVVGGAEEVNTTQLQAAIAAAKAKLEGVETSDDGSDVSTGKTWATKAAKDALKSVLEDAENVLADADADQLDVNAATLALETATAAFVPQQGSKSGGSGGGGSSGGSYPFANTVTRPDGTKVTTSSSAGVTTTTIVAPDGTTTMVNTLSDGSAVGTVTCPDGVKAIVTTKGGQTTAKVTLPAGVDEARLTIPAADVTPGTVAVLTDLDGVETVLRDCAPNEDGLRIALDGSAQLKLVDKAKSFVDVPGHWAEANVDFVSARELFNGTDAEHFSPDGTMTRGMIATVLYRLDGEHAVGASAGFADVRSGMWYTQAVEWAAEQEIVKGYSADTFAPGDNVTREQLAVMLYRYAQSVGMRAEASGELDYVDAEQVQSWAKEAVGWLSAKGVLTGKPGGLIDPAGNASRAEVATMLARFITLMAK